MHSVNDLPQAESEAKDGDGSAKKGTAQLILAPAIFIAIAPVYVHALFVIGRWSWNLIG